jgi:hypothetical protein
VHAADDPRKYLKEIEQRWPHEKTIICIDRDGTLIHDTREHLFLGRDNSWLEKVVILPYAVEPAFSFPLSTNLEKETR